ncbi:MAG: hypothetical protein DMG30_12945 [Acidobacteria bacterium]|nr:MAG: hypothetical protein DMG30_12945 [Acidobacteriota bacterium]
MQPAERFDLFEITFFDLLRDLQPMHSLSRETRFAPAPSCLPPRMKPDALILLRQKPKLPKLP